jgi:hypothetical protein
MIDGARPSWRKVMKRLTRVILVAVVALAGATLIPACGDNCHEAGCMPPCTTDDNCPAGHTCDTAAGLCVDTGDDVAADPCDELAVCCAMVPSDETQTCAAVVDADDPTACDAELSDHQAEGHCP